MNGIDDDVEIHVKGGCNSSPIEAGFDKKHDLHIEAALVDATNRGQTGICGFREAPSNPT